MARDRRLVETILYLHQQLTKAADKLDMNMSQHHLLHFLSESPRRASDFAEVAKLRKPGITAVVAALEARGWVRRETDPDDRRAQRISMTPAGRREFEAFEDAMDQALRAFLGDDAVRHANAALKDFHVLWNEKRIARYEAWKAQRDTRSLQPRANPGSETINRRKN